MNDKLMEQIAAPENLLAAWRAVRGNIPSYRRKKASGPDGVTLAEFERELQPQLEALHDMLLRGRYYPTPPARFKLPKHGGGQRVIAILPVRERVAQRAAQQVLEPLWEPEFLPCSFGFRPGISIEQAVTYVHDLRQQGERWAVDGDIATCFDSMDHDLLIDRVRNKVHDGRVIKLLQNWLDSGLLQSGPPTDADPQTAIEAHKRQKSAKDGVNWVLEAMLGGEPNYQADYGADAGEGLPNSTMNHQGSSNTLNLMARRTMLSTAWVGIVAARPHVQDLVIKAAGKIKGLAGTPAGRRILKSSSLAAGGLAGAAAVAALTAYLLNLQAGAAPVGILQGSPLSPLLANIYLHPFDLALTGSGRHLARFADDWVITAPEQGCAEQSYNEALKVLARLRLKVNPQKTRILQPEEKLEWLGVVIP